MREPQSTKRRVTAGYLRPTLAVALVGFAAAIAAAAQAQGPGVPQDPCPEDTGAATGGACDTELTPVPKDTGEFLRVAGARFDETEVPEGSFTPLTVDLFGTDFRNDDEGFFVGAQCTKPDAAFAELDGCERAPAIYHYTTPPGLPSEINQVSGPEGGQHEPGYVAAVAWMAPGKAIAVGGTGHYPRRELPWCKKVAGEDPATEALRCQNATAAEYQARDLAGEEPDAAGRARVWLYQNRRWRELDDDELPETQDGKPMGGLTTVDCSPRRTADGELCLAGGFRQLWEWRENEFTEAFTPTSTDAQGKPTVDDGAGWRFRVRQVRFVASEFADPKTHAVAVTSGCCAQSRAQDSARILFFDGEAWRSRLLLYDPTFSGSFNPQTPPEQQAAARSAVPSQTSPESLYALGVAGLGGGSVVIASGRPQAAAGDSSEPEPRSAVVKSTSEEQAGGNPGPLTQLVFTTSTGSARLVAADGDFAGPVNPNQGDGFPDWAVGVLRSSGQGLAYTTLRLRTGLQSVPNPLTCNLLSGQVPTPTDCQPNDQVLNNARSGTLVALDSYALNGFGFTPSGGVAWAVGDKGAIQRLGGEGTVGSQAEAPDPDLVGSKATASVSGASAYEGFGLGAGGAVGEVPPLAERTVELEEPRLIPAGTPRPGSNNHGGYRVESIVMSRDGSEGWAVGGSGADAAGQDILFHFDGARWRRCDPLGIAGQVEPDPACAGLGPLQRSKETLLAAARVPLENDSDPANDDEFEVVAAGTSYITPGSNSGRPVMLRYRDGRWSVDEQAMSEIAAGVGAESQPLQAIAFTAPDDGWAVKNGFGQNGLFLFHYDGTKWTNCKADPAACNDGDQILPFVQAPSSSRWVLSTAGRRVYLAGTRPDPAGAGSAATFPFIHSLDTADGNASWHADYDPGIESPDDPSAPGKLTALSVIRRPDGGYAGWATGLFGRDALSSALGPIGQGETDPVHAGGGGSGAALLRLDEAEQAGWRLYSEGDAADDYLFEDGGLPDPNAVPPRLLTLSSENGEEAFVSSASLSATLGLHPMLRFGEDQPDPEAGSAQDRRWNVLPAPFPVSPDALHQAWSTVVAHTHAMAADGQGGYWLAARQGDASRQHAKDIFFYHYTKRAPVQVFEEAPHPIREAITAAAPGPSGEYWVTTKSGAVYRYDRILGWDRLPIPGWDRGTVVTRASAASAVAVGPDGSGVVAGEGGRIAEIGPGGVRLDAAAGVGCDLALIEQLTGPCTSGHDLTSAAVAPDGSALVGGEGRALLWRPPGGAFRAITGPAQAPINTTFTGISMPENGVAYLASGNGQVFRGTGGGGGWSWELENLNDDGELVTLNAAGQGMRLNAISVDSADRGYAVGENGLVIERRGGAEHPWRRIQSGVMEDLYSVALPNGSGSGALIGGSLGLILTRKDGRFAVARTDDATDRLSATVPTDRAGRIVGLALQPGGSDGQVEAWAAAQVLEPLTRNPPPGGILHYTNAPEEPLLDGGLRRARPLPDTGQPSGDELTVAAFGRSDCYPFTNRPCHEMQATSVFNETITGGVVDQILARAGQPGGPDLALFTGDVNRTAGRNEGGSTPLDVDVMHNRWAELVASRFRDFPLYGAIGLQDLGGAQSPCNIGGPCVGTSPAGAGTSGQWQQAFAGQWDGWGAGNEERTHGDLTFKPIPPGGQDLGGAHTHYAIDILRGGSPIARLIVLDNSLRSLAASDPNQNPLEEQQGWLTQMLCKRGSAQDTPQTPCTREPSQRAIVLANTPTYSYDPSASGAGVETATDQASLESILLTGGADAVVSGRIGWNGLYYALAPGLHFPCPGGGHPDPEGTAPQAGAAPDCEGGGGAQLPPLPGQGEGAGSLPFLVASGAGGTFGPAANPIAGAASDGFWHGYSLLHLDLESGAVRVEQRPIFDWLQIRPKPGPGGKAVHGLRANQKLTLEGFGLEAAGADAPLRYDELDSFAITHVYRLLRADPNRPWLAKQAENSTPQTNPCHPYDCLDPSIGQFVDPTSQSGRVKAGNGNYARTYAVAQVSAGERSATYPLVFEPRASFQAEPLAPPPVTPPPPLKVPQPPANPSTPQVNLPATPALPLLATQSPPPPPAPPAPPSFASQAPLDVDVAPTTLDVSPPTAVTQPPTPPVNPAPPSGARREARQRQAAAQKSGADSAEGEGEGDEGVDPSDAQNRVNPVDSAQSATRIEPGREQRYDFSRRPEARAAPGGSFSRPQARAAPGGSFTPLAPADQPSAGSRALLYGGGLTLAALALAFGLTTLRPTPRRREPEVPAPAYARQRRRR